MYSKRIIFLDISGSSMNGELWDTAVAMVEAILKIDKYLDTYVCAFSDDCKLLTSQELDKVKAKKNIGISSAGTSGKIIDNFFVSAFLKNSKIIVVSDMQFRDIEPRQLEKDFKNKGAKNVWLFEVNEQMTEFYQIPMKALELSKEEEKATKKYKPTIKGK